MSTTSDPLISTKKRITTYGRKRNGASPARVAQETSTKPIPSLARPTTQAGGRAARSASRSTSPLKRSVPAEPTSRQSANVAASRDKSEDDKDTTRVVKRKQSQVQSTSRQTKKQRSSSPDSAVYDIYDDIPSSPKQAPRSKPAPAKPVPPRARHKVTPPKDTIMKDIGTTSPFSPATSKTLSSLSVGSRKAGPTQQQIPIRPPRKAPVDFGPPLLEPAEEKVTEKKPQAPPVVQGGARPRKRLIDALAAQADSSDSADESDDDTDMFSLGLKKGAVSSQVSDSAMDREIQSMTTPSQSRVMVSRETSLLSKKPGVKFTYSQERTVLAENPLDSTGSGVDIWSQSLLPDSQPKLSQMSIDEDLEDEMNSGAVRSLHELRQAGANNRTADEMDDILDRIGAPSLGKPSSARRTALLELSERIQDKTFRRQFRDHGGESTLFDKIGKETDPIAGYTIICILTTIFSSATDSLLVQRLHLNGVSHLFALLIAEERDISSVARDRKSNLSKHTQTTVAGLKTTILNIPNLWDHAPPQLSPRTLALKCLDMIIPPLVPTMTIEHQIASPAIVDELFEILSTAAGDVESSLWDFPHSAESIDLYLALNLLVKHSVPVMQSDLRPDWTKRHLPTVADIVEASLLRKADNLGELDVRAIKLTMNTANNNPDALGIFLKRGVLRELASVVCRNFAQVLNRTAGEGFQSATFESLLLMLGVMINFSEHEPSAGRLLLESETGAASLDSLIKIFLDNCATTHEADSEESSQLNVLFGYLSVLLGYLSVYRPVRERFGPVQRGGRLRPLISSIREFIAYYNKVAVDHADTDNSLGRLEALVETLEQL